MTDALFDVYFTANIFVTLTKVTGEEIKDAHCHFLLVCSFVGAALEVTSLTTLTFTTRSSFIKYVGERRNFATLHL